MQQNDQKKVLIFGVLSTRPNKSGFLDCPKEEKKQAGIEMEIAHSSLQISLQMPLQPTHPPNPALPCKHKIVAQQVLQRFHHLCSSYCCHQWDGFTSGCKWPPNYPIHQPCFGESDQETQHLVKFESKIKVSIGSLKYLAYCCTIFL